MTVPQTTTSPQAPLPQPRPPAVPAPPRPITPRARRRSWAEMPVRVWMILTVLVTLVSVYFTVTRVNEALRDRWLMQHGTDVRAKFTIVDGDPVPKRRPRNEAMSAGIVFTFGGREYRLDVPRLEPKAGAFAMVGSDQYDLKIKVDANDPTHWAEVSDPKPWIQELTVVGLLLPLVLVLIVVTLWKRQGVLRTWREGVLAAANVVEVRHTGMAPMSRVIRYSLRDGDDRRIFSTLLPTAAGVPRQGETMWLIVATNSPGKAVVASLYSGTEPVPSPSS